MTKTEQLKSELSAAELTKKEAELNIADLKARLEGEEISPAERWFNSQTGSRYIPGDQRIIVTDWAINAHEAGQKYGAETEREKFKPLMEALRPLVDIFKNRPQQDVTFLMRCVSSEYDKVRPSCYPFTGPAFELQDKPSWAEDDKDEGWKVTLTSESWTIPHGNYKLTPVED